MTRSVDDVIARLPTPGMTSIPAPPYESGSKGPRLGLAVESMKRHMSNEQPEGQREVKDA